MAPRRPSHLDQPPPVASSEEEEIGSSQEDEAGSSEEDGSSTEDEKQSPHPIVASHPPRSDVAAPSDSDTESESDEPVAAQPLASKPADGASILNKPPSSKTAVASNANLGKRPSESESDAKVSKRAKKTDSAAGAKSGDEAKNKMFQRLWSEEDEIEILKGMIEYNDKNAADPTADMNAFYDFIKKSVHVNVSKAQLTDKIRRLKKKYVNNVDKGKKGSNMHEKNAYELSKKIWGKDGILGSVKQAKSNGKASESQRGSKITASHKTDLIASPKEAKKVETDRNLGTSLCLTEMIRFQKNLGMSTLEEDGLVNRELDLIGGPKRLELEEKWKDLYMAEMEVFLKRTKLIQEQTKLVLEAYKSSNP